MIFTNSGRMYVFNPPLFNYIKIDLSGYLKIHVALDTY